MKPTVVAAEEVEVVEVLSSVVEDVEQRDELGAVGPVLLGLLEQRTELLTEELSDVVESGHRARAETEAHRETISYSRRPMTIQIPLLSTMGKPVFQIGKKADAKATGGLLLIASEPGPKDVAELRTFLDANGPRTIVQVGAKVPLSVLQHFAGTPFVLLEGGRKSFDGLETLPASVLRLSIQKQAKPFSLAGLPKDCAIERLELDVPSLTDATPIPSLRTLGWTGMNDEGAPFVAAQPNLHELALRNGAFTKLPEAQKLERLVLMTPTKLPSLVGLGSLPALRFLRIDGPKGMARLGSLAEAKALDTLLLVRAHLISDLSDISSAPKLDMLGVVQSTVDEKPFMDLKGKLTGGSFQLKTPAANKRLFEHLGIPYRKAELIENRFFDKI